MPRRRSAAFVPEKSHDWILNGVHSPGIQREFDLLAVFTLTHQRTANLREALAALESSNCRVVPKPGFKSEHAMNDALSIQRDSITD